jgi:hypothetical protein
LIAADADTLRAFRFRIENTPAGKVREIFLSDNGHALPLLNDTKEGGSRTAEVPCHSKETTRDRFGHRDKVKAYGPQPRHQGEVCSGSDLLG